MNKFGAKRSRSETFDRTFDSKGEHRRADYLRLLERAGEISDLEFQPVFKLTRAGISYRADFSYYEKGRRVVEDFKGIEDRRFRIICKLWSVYGEHPLRVVKASGSRFVTVREIFPKAPVSKTA